MNISTFLSGLEVTLTLAGYEFAREVRVLSADPLGIYAVEEGVRIFFPWSNIIMVEVDQ